MAKDDKDHKHKHTHVPGKVPPDKAARIAFEELCRSLGIPLNGNINNLIRHAVKGEWTQTTFMHYLRRTPEYKDTFPGKPKDMSESQYISLSNSYQQVADMVGVKLSDDNMKRLFKEEVSAQEWQTRATVIARIRDNAAAFAQFAQTLKAQGLLGKGHQWDLQDAIHFITGEASPEWYRVWQEASTRIAATMVGFDITKHPKTMGYMGLTRNQILGINAAAAGTGMTEAERLQSFAELAQQFRTVLPESAITGFGVTKNDLIELEFGGKHQAEVAERVQRILATVQARQTPLAEPQFTYTQQGPQMYGLGTQRAAQTE